MNEKIFADLSGWEWSEVEFESEIDAEIARREVSHKRREKMSGDISECLTADSYIVTGFFTSDYHSIARRFAGQLTRHAISHWLYSWSPEEWQKAILAKPLIVKRAMQGFPGRTIILMDIDCDVTGPIYPVLECATDISLFIGVGIDPRREEGLRVRALPSSRIIVWRPTAGARRLLDTWEALCQEQITSPILNDEQLLMQAIGATAGLTLTVIDPRYAARNPWDHPPGAVIVHQTDPITRTCGPGRLLRAET